MLISQKQANFVFGLRYLLEKMFVRMLFCVVINAFPMKISFQNIVNQLSNF